ncbi:MAG TPA: sensor histidine kinase [Mycobacteriales bacterium]
MATLAELIRAHTDLPDGSVDHLRALVADWQLLSDLSFADLSLWVRSTNRDFVCVAHVRPVTAATAHESDQVGRRIASGELAAVESAWREQRFVREGEPIWAGGTPLRQEALPVHHGGLPVAVVTRDTNLSAVRTPSQLELTYLATAGDLLQMVAEGRFPFPRQTEQQAEPPRVGDGFLRLDAGGTVVFASPNALSAYRRLGLSGNLTGERLRVAHENLGVVGAPIWRTLATRRPESGDVEGTSGTELSLRAVPILPGDELRGAAVLLRDVTEVRRRERALLSKDATIREIHHRVKNNLQTVAALLRLQARRTDAEEARLALVESVRRVTSIALVHETLSQTLDEIVGFDAVADQVAASVLELAATGRRATVRRTGSFGDLPATVATPLALVLSELLSNAVEHAYAGEGGSLEVRVDRGSAGMEVVVADDGAGLPADFELEGSTRLGLQIVRALVVGEMRGTIVLRPRTPQGTEAVVAIPAAQLVEMPLGPG